MWAKTVQGGAGGSAASDVTSGEFTVTAASQQVTIDTKLGRKPSFFYCIGKATNFSNDDVYKMVGTLWQEPTDGTSNERYKEFITGGTTYGVVTAFNIQTTDINKIRSIGNDGVVTMEMSGTASTAVGNYRWFAG